MKSYVNIHGPSALLEYLCTLYLPLFPILGEYKVSRCLHDVMEVNDVCTLTRYSAATEGSREQKH